MLDRVIPGWQNISEPETISIILQRNNIDLSPIEMDMINALKTLLAVDTPWQDPFIFENIVDAVNGNPVMPETITKPPLENIMCAVQIMNDIRKLEFSEDIAKYIAAVAINDEMIYLPKPISFANKCIPNILPKLRERIRLSIDEILNLPLDYPFKETEEDVQIAKIITTHHAFKNKF